MSGNVGGAAVAMNTNYMTQQVFHFHKVVGADHFATYHSVSAPVINKFVRLSLSGLPYYSSA